MTAYHPHDENDSPAPILRVVKPRIGWGGGSMEQPEEPQDRPRLNGCDDFYANWQEKTSAGLRRYWAKRKAAA